MGAGRLTPKLSSEKTSGWVASATISPKMKAIKATGTLLVLRKRMHTTNITSAVRIEFHPNQTADLVPSALRWCASDVVRVFV